MVYQLLLFTITLVVFPLPAQQPNPTIAYRNDQLHFTFMYPAGYANRVTPDRLAAARDTAKASSPHEMTRVVDCTQIPVAAVRPNGALFDMIMILSMDTACSRQRVDNSNLLDFTRGVAKTILNKHGEAKLGSSASFDLNGRPAIYLPETVDETARSPGRILRSGSICTIIDKTAVCWILISYSQDTLAQLLQLPITFDGKAARPLMIAPPAQEM